MLRTFWGSKWGKNKNVEAQKKIRRSYKKKSVYIKIEEDEVNESIMALYKLEDITQTMIVSWNLQW